MLGDEGFNGVSLWPMILSGTLLTDYEFTASVKK